MKMTRHPKKATDAIIRKAGMEQHEGNKASRDDQKLMTPVTKFVEFMCLSRHKD